MALMQEQRKINTYPRNLYTYQSRVKAIEYEKLDNLENRITDVESGLKDLCEWLQLENHMTNDNQRLAIRHNENIRYEDRFNRKRMDKPAERTLETIALTLNGIEDKTLQVQIVGELVDEIREMLADIPKQKNNYRRQMLLMLHEALKQNYTKKLFNEIQVKALIEAARVCNEEFVAKEQYFSMDKVLCECDLDMMPDLE